MTLEVDQDESDPLGVGADQYSPVADPVSLAEAGFEAGLSVVVEAMPAPCVVLDQSCHVVTCNRLARALVQLLKKPAVVSTLARVTKPAIRSEAQTTVRLPLGYHRFETYVVTPLGGPYARERALFLLIGPDPARPKEGHDETALSRYEVAPTPARALRAEAAKFKRLSETDPLTGALNVRAFAARVTQALQVLPRRKGAMICLDLNGFKAVNDEHGHAAGDKVLMHVAAKLTFPPHTWIETARMGGDEFALWIPGVEPGKLTSVIAGIRARLSLPVDLPDPQGANGQIRVTAAIGAACCPDEALNYDTMRRLADTRMYDEKADRKETRGRRGSKRKGAVDPAPQSFLPR